MNCWPPTPTSLSQGSVVAPCAPAEVRFRRGTWQVPLYFSSSCILQLRGPSGNWQPRKCCPCLKEGGSLQAGRSLAEPTRLSSSSRSVRRLQQQALPSRCGYVPLGASSYSRRQVKSPLPPQPFCKELRPLHPAPLLSHKMFCFWKVLFSTRKALLAGKMVAQGTLKCILRFCFYVISIHAGHRNNDRNHWEGLMLAPFRTDRSPVTKAVTCCIFTIPPESTWAQGMHTTTPLKITPVLKKSVTLSSAALKISYSSFTNKALRISSLTLNALMHFLEMLTRFFISQYRCKYCF